MLLKKNFILLLLLNLIHLGLFAQLHSLLSKFDSLDKSFNNAHELIDLTEKISDYNSDTALVCAYEIQKINIPEKEHNLQTKVLILLGSLTKNKGKYEEATTFFKEGLTLTEKHNSTNLQIIILYQLGDLNRAIGLLDISLSYLYMARNLAYKHKINHKHPKIYNRLSATFFQLSDINYYKYDSITIPNQNDIPFGRKTADDYLRLCKTYADSALIYSKLNNNTETTLSTLNLLGAYFRNNKQYKKASENFYKAIDMAKKNHILADVPNFYVNISRIYFDQKQYKKAIEIASKGYKMADSLNNLVYIASLAQYLCLSYKELGDYKNVYKYNEIESNARKELYHIEKWSKISELEKKFQTEQKQKEIEHQQELLNLQNKQLSRLSIIVFILVIIFVSISISIALIQKQKKKINAQANKISEQYHNLEKLDSFKKMLTGTLVHDLKNPLNYIIGSTKDKTIRQSGLNMLNIVLNVLDVNKAQTTKLSVNFENCEVKEVIEKAVSQVEFLAEQKNLQIEIIKEKENVINADISLTTRILVNLLTNAIKYSPLNNKVTIQVEEQNNQLAIYVIDYGIGISKENIQFIFDEYTQISAKNSGKIQSTGLGLTFCKLAAEAQNAEINVCSIPNKRTRFCLIFQATEVSKKKIKKEAKTIKDDFLTEEEKEYLLPILKELSKMETFQASEILKLLNSLEDSSENIGKWKQKVKNAMLTTNNELFKQLTRYGV